MGKLYQRISTVAQFIVVFHRKRLILGFHYHNQGALSPPMFFPLRWLLRIKDPFVLRLGERSVFLYSQEGACLERVLFENAEALDEAAWLKAVFKAAQALRYRGGVQVIVGGLHGLTKTVSLASGTRGDVKRVNKRQAIACAVLPGLSLSERLCFRAGALMPGEYLFVGFREVFLSQICQGLEAIGLSVQAVWPGAWVDYTVVNKEGQAGPLVVLEPGLAQAFLWEEGRPVYRRWAWSHEPEGSDSIRHVLQEPRADISYLSLPVQVGELEEASKALCQAVPGLVVQVGPFAIPQIARLELRPQAWVWRGRGKHLLKGLPRVLLCAVSIPLLVAAYTAGRVQALQVEVSRMETQVAPMRACYYSMKGKADKLAVLEVAVAPALRLQAQKGQIFDFVCNLEAVTQGVQKTYLNQGEFSQGREASALHANFTAITLLDAVEEGEARSGVFLEALIKLQEKEGFVSLKFDARDSAGDHQMVTQVQLGESNGGEL